MESAEKWRRYVTIGLLALILVSLIIMAYSLSKKDPYEIAKGAWAVGLIALLAAVGTFFLGASLHGWELKRHVLDVTAHPGGFEAINQDLEKVGNIISEQRDLLRQIPDLLSRVERLEAWEGDLAKGAQALSHAEKLSKALSELSIGVSSKIEGHAASLRDLRSKLVELEPLKERAVQSEGLAGLSAELQKIAERSALLAEELTRVKQELEQQGKLGQDLTKLREEITDLSAVAGEIGRLQQKSEDLGEAATKLGARLTDLEREKDKVSQALEKSAQAIAALEARPAGAAGAAAPPPGDLAAKLKAVTAEMAEVKQALAQLQAEQPHLDVNIQDAKLVSQQDRTVIVCTLTVRNVSNRPNEITAVRAELDSGRDRMAPTSIRHWLPDGKQTNEERLILLPQKVLENSTTAPITLTAIGWPLEKSLESYAFRITVKDKSGNEYIKNHRLVPEPAS